MRRRLALALGCAIALAYAPVARADQATLDAARQAYDRGAASYDAKEYGRAAVELARADELMANDVALELAIKAAVKADDPRLAMTLAARGARRPNAGVAAAAEQARQKMAGKTGTVIVMCPLRPQCSPTVDGEAVHAGAPHIVLVGDHQVVIDGGGGPRDVLTAKVAPDAVVEMRAPVPSESPSPGPVAVLPAPRAKDEATRREPMSASEGLPAGWFWVGVGLTAALGAVTIASAVDTSDKHEAFRAQPTQDLQDRGLDAQLRTNLLAGGTGLVGIATLVAGAFFVKWGGERTPSQAAR
ncbi:MAG: hypothetical protein JST00_33850 [Deltaproteobacteria bacterium]|nr:hypothetical protein [Deltaproteobacteria bacterium]